MATKTAEHKTDKEKKHSVTIYSTPTCVYCQLAKEFFKANEVSFKEINVAENQKAAQEMIERSGQMGVPVIDVDGALIIGFDRPALKNALGLN